MMKIDDLIRIVSDSYPLDIVDFENEYPNEAHCIRRSSGKWEVYYSERGQKSGRKIFSSESEACNYLLSEIKLATTKAKRN